LFEPLLLHLIDILGHLQFTSFLDHILEIAEAHDHSVTLTVQQGRVFARTTQQEPMLDLLDGNSSFE